MDYRYTVYVVRLAKGALPARRSGKPPVYVGQTALTARERFRNHKRGHKASRIVRKHGLCLMPSLMPRTTFATRAEAERAEAALAKRLMRLGYPVHYN